MQGSPGVLLEEQSAVNTMLRPILEAVRTRWALPVGVHLESAGSRQATRVHTCLSSKQTTHLCVSLIVKAFPERPIHTSRIAYPPMPLDSTTAGFSVGETWRSAG